jgi:hypothetical protein
MTTRDDTPDHEQLADELERDTRRLEQRSEEVESDIEHTRQDWESKRRDDSAPGAKPPADAEGDDENKNLGES